MFKLTSDNHSDFEGLKFLSDILLKPGDAAGRTHLFVIKIDEEGHAMSTDGNRAHEYRMTPLDDLSPHSEEIPAGFYEVLKNTKTMLWLEPLPTEGVTYPDFGALRDPCEIMAEAPVYLNGDYSRYDALARIHRAMPEKYCLNWTFLTPLPEGDWNITVCLDGGRVDLHRIDSGMTAYLMPIQFKKAK